MAVVKKIATLLGVALVATQGCKSHSSTSCGDPYLTNVTYVGYGGVGWGGYIVDPYYDGYGYGYGYGSGGWFNPGDDYDPSAPEPDNGWDSHDGDYFPGADDPGSDVGDPSGGVSGDTDTGSDTGGGVDTGDTASYRVRIASGGTGSSAEQQDARGCYSCLVGCRVGSGDTGRQAMGGSSYDYASACRTAVHRLERWAHSEQGAAIVDCQVLIPTPISEADAGPDARLAADATIGTEEDASTTPVADAGADADASNAQP